MPPKSHSTRDTPSAATIPLRFAATVAQLPAGLQRVVERELAAGNTIAEAGSFFPAAPVGTCVKFSEPFRAPAEPLPDGVKYRKRHPGAQFTAEFFDEKELSYVIDTPPPYVQPTPTAGNAHSESWEEMMAGVRKLAASPAKKRDDDTTCVLDFRGETLTYSEGKRSTTMLCFWAKRYSIVSSSIKEWVYRSGRRAPVTDEERAIVIERVVRYAREKQNVTMEVDP